MAGVSEFRKALAKKFDDEIRFFKGWIDRPKAVGSIVPTSSVTARRMASVVDPASGLPVLEVGPGTGVITRAILERGVLPGDLVAVEYAEDFVRHLRRAFPGEEARLDSCWATSSLERFLYPQSHLIRWSWRLC